MRDELQAALDPAELARYAIRGGDADFEEALGGRALKPGIVNVRLRSVQVPLHFSKFEAILEEALGGQAPNLGIVNVRLRLIHVPLVFRRFCCLRGGAGRPQR